MKIEKRDEFDLSFPLPEKGTYRLEFQEGARLTEYTNDKGDKHESFYVPTKIIDHDEFENIPIGIFVTLSGKEFTRKLLGGLINAAGLYTAYMKKFPGDIEADDPKVIQQLIIDLPERTMKGDVEISKNPKTGKERADIVRFMVDKKAPVGSGGAGKAAVKPALVPEVMDENAGEPEQEQGW